MRAVVQDGYGDPADVLRVAEVPEPQVGTDEVLVKVLATSVHPDVWHVLVGQPRVLRIMGSGLRRPSPRIPGTEMAGEVVAVGTAVTTFEPGDLVFGETVAGMQWRNGGAWAESVAVPAAWLALVPAGLTPQQAATLATAGLIVLSNWPRQVDVGPGSHVLVNGAGGGVGGIAVQVARARGAEVTGVDRGDKLDHVTQQGAHDVIDYTEADFTRSGRTWDVVFDIPGNHDWTELQRVVAGDGAYVLVGHDGYGMAGRWFGSIPRVFGFLIRARSDPRVAMSMASVDKPTQMAGLIREAADGALVPVVGHTFALEGAADAMALLTSGDAHGRIILDPTVTPTTPGEVAPAT